MRRYISIEIDGSEYPINLLDIIVSAAKEGREVEVEPYKMSRGEGVKAWWVTDERGTKVFENGELRDVTDEERWEWL